MAKIDIIEYCGDCSRRYYVDNDMLCRLTAGKKAAEGWSPIPDWCPLEDAAEGGWIDIDKQPPNDGDLVLGYFDVFNSVEIYKYVDLSKTEFSEHGRHQFQNASGFLTDDIRWWMPKPAAPKEKK